MRLRPSALAAGLLAAACAASKTAPPSTSVPDGVQVVRHVDVATPPPRLAGHRCDPSAATCTCRASDDEERAPPASGWKRFEIRVSAHQGEAALDVSGIGVLPAAGVRDTCYYVDLANGSSLSARFSSRATQPRSGFTPRLRIAEYGPSGPFWYDTLEMECVGSDGRCDRAGADAWAARARLVKRGRVDPCGSAVVTKLHWENQSAESARDGGYFHDFAVTFDLEVKKFATQFAPGATECVPK